MGLNTELHVYYSYFDALAVSAEYYRLELVPAKSRANLVKGLSAVCATAATSAFFDAVTDWMALLAPISAAAPYAAMRYGYSDDRVALLRELWVGYKAQCEAMHGVLDELKMVRERLLDERTIPDEIRAKKLDIERAVSELSRKDEPPKPTVVALATANVHKKFPPHSWWYAR